MRPTIHDPDVEDVETEDEAEDPIEGKIDLNSDDSFPASDPPSWSPTVNGPPPKKPRKQDPIV